MKKIGKLIVHLIAAVTLLTSGVQSFNVTADTASTYKTEKVFVTQFDNYNDISGCETGKGARLNINKNKDFIKNGKGSLKLEDFSNTGALHLSMYADSSASSYTTYSNVESFNVSIYNPGQYVAKGTFLVYTKAGIILTKNFEVQPGIWNNIAIVQNRLQTYTSTETIYSYRFDLLQPAEPEITYYFDDFYLVTSNEEPATPTKVREEKEILHFDSLVDLNLIAKSSLASKGRTSDTFSINLMSQYAQKNGSLLIDVTKNGTAVSMADVWTDGTVPYYAEKTGFSVLEKYLSQIDFTGMNALKVDVFHTYGAARKVHLTITDRDANTVSVSQYIESDTWTTLELSDLAKINKDKITSITFYYEAYQTFRDYEIYVDNLVIA